MTFSITGQAESDNALAGWLTDSGEQVTAVHRCTGGSINDARILVTASGRRLFVKFCADERTHGAFAKEFAALQKLSAPGVITVPVALLAGDTFLLTTAFTAGVPAGDWQEQTGRNLALLHQATVNDCYGFEFDNLLGLSLQSNTPDRNWVRFWREQRLLPQLNILASSLASNDTLLELGYRLAEVLEEVIGNVDEPPVLLHGDLWSGNAAADEHGSPVIFDPASWYGSREAEFGMMRLFGGFGARCEAAYAEVWPFSPDHDRRITVYRLYHELNHLILFGRGYYASALQSLRSIL